MHKKNLIIVFLVIVLAGVFVYPRLLGGTAAAVQLSDVTANPSKFIGKLSVSGNVGTVYVEDGVFELLDAKGCCNIPIMVPMTAAQQQELELKTLYTGKLPAQGDSVVVSGTLKRESTYYLIEVEKVTRNGEVIISKR